jgi:hypothetical protein
MKHVPNKQKQDLYQEKWIKLFSIVFSLVSFITGVFFNRVPCQFHDHLHYSRCYYQHIMYSMLLLICFRTPRYQQGGGNEEGDVLYKKWIRTIEAHAR